MSRRRFNTVQKSCGWKHAYDHIKAKYGAVCADELFDRASELYGTYSSRYKGEKGVRKGHVLGAVSVSSLYIPLSELTGKGEAKDLIAESMRPVSVAKHNKIERLPAPVFMRVAGFITGRIFSEKAGFKRNWHCNTNREKSYDLLTCPYVKTFNELGCPEVCPSVCIQDDISFGNLKNGVVFERKGTMGRGDSCCDFCFRISGKE